MTILTTNLGLVSYNTITDASAVLIYSYIDQVSGSLVTQNLGIVDAFAGRVNGSLVELSASMVTVFSRANNTHSAVIQIVAPATDVDTTSGIFYFRCPSEINGMNLHRYNAFLNTAGLTGDYTVQARNMTKYSSNDACSVPATISSGLTTGIPATINTSYDDVATDDQIKFYVTGEPSTKGQGLQIVAEFVYP